LAQARRFVAMDHGIHSKRRLANQNLNDIRHADIKHAALAPSFVRKVGAPPLGSNHRSGLGDLREDEGEYLRASGHVDRDLVFENARRRAHLTGAPCVGEEFGTWLRYEWNILRS
jgi:hypothetical protein